MKIRSDFVTNSSSSSFILGFKSEAEMQSTLEKEYAFTREHAMSRDDDEDFDPLETVLSDCINADKLSLSEVLSLAREELEYPVLWDVEDRYPYSMRREVRESKEFKQACEEEMDKRLKIIEMNAKKTGSEVFVEVSYNDHTLEGSSLEHYIVPELGCCIQRFNHH